MTLGKCYVRNVYSNLKSRMWKHDMPCTSEKIITAEVSGQTSKNVNVRYVFHNANSILYTAHPLSVPLCLCVCLSLSLSLSLSPDFSLAKCDPIILIPIIRTLGLFKLKLYLKLSKAILPSIDSN